LSEPSSTPPATSSTPAVLGENDGNPSPLTAPQPKITDLIHDLRKWSDRATKGDKAARDQLRRLLDRPDCFRLFRDLAGRVRNAVIHKATGGDWFGVELTQLETDRLRAELLGPSPSAVERLLVERVAIGWLEVHSAEYQIAVCKARHREYWQHQVNHAHRRFLSALRLLAAVRHLPRPVVQVNIGEQQVNLSGG
jgi:hypothetical protein